jgi:3-oxoacyl-[acyl-carrier protein] reductase
MKGFTTPSQTLNQGRAFDYESNRTKKQGGGGYVRRRATGARHSKSLGGVRGRCGYLQMLPYQSAYVSGKRGMDGVYRILAKEVGEHNITVNQVAPGWTISDNCRNIDGAEKNTMQDYPYISTVPMKWRPKDTDIANCVCFLASDLAGFITGVYLPVCGGNVMPCI